MLYNESDIGKIKVNVAKEKLTRINPEMEIIIFEKFMNCSEDIINIFSKNKVDFIVLCADTPRGKIPLILDNVALLLKIKTLYIGPETNHIVIGPLIIPEVTLTLRDLLEEADLAENKKDSDKDFTEN